jgi:hypothetical protein
MFRDKKKSITLKGTVSRDFSLRLFFINKHYGILRGLGETDSGEKPDVGNLVALSRLNIPFNTIKKVVKIPRLSIVIPQRYCFYHARYP